MAVYVDDMRAPYGRMVMCHMMADTTQELLAMADRIGVKRRWIQKPGTPDEHFDISLSKRALAVQYGAREIEWRDTAILMDRRREKPRFPHKLCSFEVPEPSSEDVEASCRALPRFQQSLEDAIREARGGDPPVRRRTI